LKEPCPYFNTKPENVPVNLLGAIQAAEECKEEKMLGLLKPDLDSLSAFEYTCYKVAEYAANTVDSEETKKAIKASKDGNKSSLEKFGNANPLPVRSDDDPFKNWEK
jgi:hypothetical protein